MKDSETLRWDEVRRILKDWMHLRHKSLRELSAEAGVDAGGLSRFLNGERPTIALSTAANLYPVMQRDLQGTDRQTFLNVTGLSSIMAKIDPALLSEGVNQPDLTKVSPHDRGTFWMAKAISTALVSWEAAIPLYQAAEQEYRWYGKTSSQAALAATMLAQLFVNLGDYDAAQRELDRVQAEYRDSLDARTTSELHRIAGWICYYSGDYKGAVPQFVLCQKTAEEYGNDYLAESAQHFLGRVFSDWGELHRLSGATTQADRAFAESERAFEAAIQIHRKFGADEQVAFDLLRKAQLLRAQGRRADEARALRSTARSIAGKDMIPLHFNLEDARVALEDGSSLSSVTRLVADALHEGVALKYAKGISDALAVLGDTHVAGEKLESALESYVAALCIYPYEHHLRNEKLWNDAIPALLLSLAPETHGGSVARLIEFLEKSAEQRQGYFRYLDSITIHRPTDMAQLFAKMRNLGTRI